MVGVGGDTQPSRECEEGERWRFEWLWAGCQSSSPLEAVAVTETRTITAAREQVGFKFHALARTHASAAPVDCELVIEPSMHADSHGLLGTSWRADPTDMLCRPTMLCERVSRELHPPPRRPAAHTPRRSMRVLHGHLPSHPLLSETPHARPCPSQRRGHRSRPADCARSGLPLERPSSIGGGWGGPPPHLALLTPRVVSPHHSPKLKSGEPDLAPESRCPLYDRFIRALGWSGCCWRVGG